MVTKEEFQESVRQRMFSGVSFTFQQLCRNAERSHPGLEKIEGQETWRIIDNEIQKARKKGLISFIRNGRESFWSMASQEPEKSK